MTARGADTVSWDGRDRMRGGSFSGTSISYSFDSVGRTRQRLAGGVTARYLLDNLFETNAAGAIQLSDIDGASADVAHYAGPPTLSTSVEFLYYNDHGDLAAQTDAAGNRTATYGYDAFGSSLDPPPANAYIERWTALWDKKFDSASGLIEMGARPYDPTLGRFLAVDPVQGGALNGYDYAGQDPVNHYDLAGTVFDNEGGEPGPGSSGGGGPGPSGGGGTGPGTSSPDCDPRSCGGSIGRIRGGTSGSAGGQHGDIPKGGAWKRNKLHAKGENEIIKAVARQEGVDRRELGRAVEAEKIKPGEKLSYEEIRNIAKQMKEEGRGKGKRRKR